MPVSIRQKNILGGYGGEETPDPIPNSEAKLTSADGTAYCGRVGRRRPSRSRLTSRDLFLFIHMAKKVKKLFFISNPRTIVVSTDVTYLAVFTDVVGIEDNGVSEISIFPNPTNDILNITFSEIIFEIEIVNALGQVVKRVEVNSGNVVCNVENLSSGVYVVRIYYFDTSTNSVHRKLIERFEQKKIVKE